MLAIQSPLKYLRKQCQRQKTAAAAALAKPSIINFELRRGELDDRIIFIAVKQSPCENFNANVSLKLRKMAWLPVGAVMEHSFFTKSSYFLQAMLSNLKQN
jgi:hypothetical protein